MLIHDERRNGEIKRKEINPQMFMGIGHHDNTSRNRYNLTELESCDLGLKCM